MVTAPKTKQKTLPEIKEIIARHKAELAMDYSVSDIGIFGSYVRGEQKPGSDVDILVDFARPISFFKFIHLENRLKELLGIKVDLVTRKALKPVIGRRILKEVCYL